METKELVKLNVGSIKLNPEYKALYIKSFKAFFGKEPCLTCGGAQHDFMKFKNKVLNLGTEKETYKKQEEMKQYKLKPEYLSDVHSFAKNGTVHRMYGSHMTDEFAKDYLSNGSKKQLEERKAKFLSIPTAKVEKVAEPIAEEVEKVEKPKAKRTRKKKD